MKNIIDAVNEFKGEWERIIYTCIQKGEEIAIESFGNDADFNETKGFISRGIAGFNKSKYRKICNEKQFNDLVSQMETNFGECNISYSEHCSNESVRLQKSDKEVEVMDRDGSKAPKTKGECCYVDSSLDGVPSGFYEDRKPKMFFRADSMGNKKDDGYLFRSDDYSDKIAITRQPQPKPVFTQEMCDDDEYLPTVDMLVKHQGVEKEVIGELDVNNKLALKSIDNGIYSLAHINDIFPTTPPIELIDGKAYQFYIEEVTNIFHAIWSKERQQMCTEHSYFYKRVCEGIQPLTVEVK